MFLCWLRRSVYDLVHIFGNKKTLVIRSSKSKERQFPLSRVRSRTVSCILWTWFAPRRLLSPVVRTCSRASSSVPPMEVRCKSGNKTAKNVNSWFSTIIKHILYVVISLYVFVNIALYVHKVERIQKSRHCSSVL